jgi:hypothetical protein
MRVAEVIAPVVTSEEDLPIIYDIIRSKLEAGTQVWVLFGKNLRLIQGLSCRRSISGNELLIVMGFHDSNANTIDRVLNYSYEPHTVQQAWRLKKEDDKWILTVV